MRVSGPRARAAIFAHADRLIRVHAPVYLAYLRFCPRLRAFACQKRALIGASRGYDRRSACIKICILSVVAKHTRAASSAAYNITSDARNRAGAPVNVCTDKRPRARRHAMLIVSLSCKSAASLRVICDCIFLCDCTPMLSRTQNN